MIKTGLSTIAFVILIAGCMPIAPANDYKFSADDACSAPVRPAGYSDSGAISNYQAQRDKFMECVNHEDTSSPTYQSDLDQSLGMIGDDQLQGIDIQQQETRGALDKLRR